MNNESESSSYPPVANFRHLDRLDVLADEPPDLSTDVKLWNDLHDDVQEQLSLLAKRVSHNVADVQTTSGCTVGRRYYLFTHLTFELPNRGIDPVVAGVTFTAEGANVRIKADISGEETGDVIVCLPDQVVSGARQILMQAARAAVHSLCQSADLIVAVLTDPARHVSATTSCTLAEIEELGRLKKQAVSKRWPWRYEPKAPMFVGTTHAIVVGEGEQQCILLDCGRDKDGDKIGRFIEAAANRCDAMIVALRRAWEDNAALRKVVTTFLENGGARMASDGQHGTARDNAIFEMRAAFASGNLLAEEVARLRALLWVEALCGGCGKKYHYNRADDPNGDIAGKSHGRGLCC